MLSSLFLFICLLGTVYFEIDNISLQIFLGCVFVIFKERMIFPIWLLDNLILSFPWLEINLFRMQQIMQVLLFQRIISINWLLSLKFQFRKILLSLFLPLINTVRIIVIIALYWVFEHLSYSTLSVLVSP